MFTRQQLYDQVWLKPGVQLAEELGVSDVAIGKTCKKHSIPRPPPGYWAKVQHGQKVAKPRLPKLDDPYLQEITIEPVPEWLREAPLTDATNEKIRAERADENKIVVPGTIESPHPLVERTARSFRSATSTREGLLAPKAKGCLDVAVSKDSIDRAMRLMDAFIKAAEARGMNAYVRTDQEHGRLTTMKAEGEAFSFWLAESLGERERELTEHQKRENAKYVHVKPYATHEPYPRGLFSFNVRGQDDGYIQKRWSELDGKKLDERLNSIIAWLYKAAEQIKERRERFAARDQQWAEEARLREEAEKRQREEERKIKELESEVAAWRKATSIRQYVDAAEEAAIAKHGSIATNSEMDRWMNWAREYAQRIDPLG